MKFKLFVFFVFALAVVFVIGCDNAKVIDSNPTKIVGTGQYIYDDYEPFAGKSVTCFYHIPPNSNSTTPILIVLPGASRDANVLRDGLIAKANQKEFIVLALSFPTAFFPGSDAYNLANIFDDGDNPTPSTLNPEEVWTFSVINPIFLDFKLLIGNANLTYDLFGHSAGAQLAHRFLIFQPNADFNRVVLSASGWYTMPDTAITFPYGLEKSPAENSSMAPVFGKNAFVIVGENDTDPNSFNLRHTPEADLQGNNRLQRAQYFYQESRAIAITSALPFNWQYATVPNTGHDSQAMSNYAADLLY